MYRVMLRCGVPSVSCSLVQRSGHVAPLFEDPGSGGRGGTRPYDGPDVDLLGAVSHARQTP